MIMRTQRSGGVTALAGCWASAVMLIVTFQTVHTAEKMLHEHMTPRELRSLFHIEDYKDIPDYHLVQLNHHITRRYITANHQGNSHQKGSPKVPHEKHQMKKKIMFEDPPPSLVHDQMSFSIQNGVDDAELLSDLNESIPIHIGDESESDSDNSHKDREQVIESDEDVHKINLNVFGKDMELVLKKQEGLVKKDGLKLWTVLKNETQPNGVDYLEMTPTDSEEDEDVGELYQDEQTGTALLIRRHPKRGSLLVEGSIGPDVVIRPIPDSLVDPASLVSETTTKASTTPSDVPPDDEMFMDSDMDDMVSIDTGLPIRRHKEDTERIKRALAGAQHVLIRRTPADQDHSSDYALMEPDHLAKRFRRKRSTDQEGRSSRRKRDAPYVIYPEILVIVDYDGYRLHGGDNAQIKRYFVSFWNGVDLRYKLLKGPKIRISIAGIIISRGRDATPYLERNRVGRDAIDSAAALTDMGKYLFRERRLPVYDIAVAITKYDMCRRRKGGRCTKGTAGFAYVGGACVVNKRLEKVNSVAIIEDTGGFSGIIVAAHEVGHLLGAVHDGSPPPSYLGGPGAEKCRWEDGYIMSDLRHTEKGFRWSPCSVHSFHHFLNGDTATCLYNSPHEDDSLPRVLPGRLLTLDAQCRKDRGTSACFKDDRVCAQLFCFDAGSGYCVAYRPAAEGSPCGDGQYCMNGRCITEHENIIPDYSQHTPSFIRADTSPFYGLNYTSYEATTQPYSPENTQGFYQTSTSQPETYMSSIYTLPSSLSTETPHSYYYHSTSQTPFDYNSFTIGDSKSTSFGSPSSSATRSPFVYKYSLATTKSPYDFSDFSTKHPPRYYYDDDTTRKSKIYGKYEVDPNIGKPTTRSPHGFTYKTASKPLFKFGTLYQKNDIRPDANSQDGVEVHPEVISGYHRNVSSIRFGTSLCSTSSARLRPECQPNLAAAISH